MSHDFFRTLFWKEVSAVSDHAALDASLTRYTRTRAYNAATLRNDLDRFTFLLGGNNGETLFHPGQQ